MTLLETLNALQEGKKITTKKWLNSKEIKSVDSLIYPLYIQYDPNTANIVDNELECFRYLDLNENYIIYNEPLLNTDEKNIILMLLSYIDYKGFYRLYIKKDRYGISINDEFENIERISLGFEGLKESCKFSNLKEDKYYYLEDLGIKKDMNKETR